MPETESYNILVIGSGEAGKYLAWTMAKAGHRTAVVERRYIGGSCPNIACLPSKNVIHSAKVASLTARGAEFGVEAGPVTTNMKAVQLRKRKMVEDLIKVHSDGCDRAIPKILTGRESNILPYKSNLYKLSGKDVNVAGLAILSSSTC